MSISIVNLVDIKSEVNKELVMRIKSDVRNGDTFFTDLNGFQVSCSSRSCCRLAQSIGEQQHFSSTAVTHGTLRSIAIFRTTFGNAVCCNCCFLSWLCCCVEKLGF